MESKMFAFGLFMLFYIVQSSAALKCYFCDSVSNPRCSDIEGSELQAIECISPSPIPPTCIKVVVGDGTYSYVNRNCIQKIQIEDPCIAIRDGLEKKNAPVNSCYTCATDGCNSGNSMQLFSTLIVFGAIVCTARLFV